MDREEIKKVVEALIQERLLFEPNTKEVAEAARVDLASRLNLSLSKVGLAVAADGKQIDVVIQISEDKQDFISLSATLSTEQVTGEELEKLLKS